MGFLDIFLGLLGANELSRDEREEREEKEYFIWLESENGEEDRILVREDFFEDYPEEYYDD